MKNVYPDLVIKGAEKLDGEEVVVLEAKPSATSKEQFSFSEKSGLLVRHHSEFESDGNKTGLDRRLSDYREVEGANYPFLRKLQLAMNGQELFALSLTVKEIKHNEKIDDGKFSKP